MKIFKEKVFRNEEIHKRLLKKNKIRFREVDHAFQIKKARKIFLHIKERENKNCQIRKIMFLKKTRLMIVKIKRNKLKNLDKKVKVLKNKNNRVNNKKQKRSRSKMNKNHKFKSNL